MQAHKNEEEKIQLKFDSNAKSFKRAAYLLIFLAICLIIFGAYFIKTQLK